MAREDSNVIVAIHGVGSPAPGDVAQTVCEGYIRAYPTDPITTKPLLLGINPSPKSHTYRGVEVRRGDRTIQIWELNWSDLKGLPKGRLGTALYALKAVVAMLQLSDEGWQPTQNGIIGKLIFGGLLRTYFCTFSLVVPLVMLAIAFAYVQDNASVAVALLITFYACILIALWRMLSVDSRFRLSVLVLTIGFCVALGIIGVDVGGFEDEAPEAPGFLSGLIQTIGFFENFIAIIALLTILEILIRRIRTKRSKSNEPNTWTVFISRTGLVIVALTMGSAAYGAVVNAMGFFFLGKLLIPMHLVAKDKFNVFQELYLGSIGYNLAEMEFVNWLTTFSIGGFLVAGVGYQLFKISTSRDGSETPRGYYIQNVVSAFLWFSLAGFLIVFFSYLAGITGWLHLSNCSGKTCKIFSIELSPFEIYLVSATRILPFLLPIFLSSLRVGLNVAADILLYILPTKFPLSIQEKASSRLAVLLDYLRSKHPEKPISLLAHSQGTVIGRDVLEATPVDQFVTAGSPLSSLYDRFLGIPVAMPITGCHWVNMYRVSDYIAGPLHQKGVQDVEVKTNYRANHLHYFDDSAVVARALGKADAPEVIRPIVTESTSEPSSPTMSDLGCRLLISNVCVILLLVVAANAFFMAVVLGHDTASTVIWSSAGALAKMLVGEDPDRLLTFSLLSSICVFAGGVIGGICINDTRRRSWIWLASFVVCYLLVLQYITGVPLDEWWYTDCKPDGSDCRIHFSTYSSTPIRLVSWALGTPSALYLGAVCSNWLMRICDGNSSTSSS